VRQNPASSPSGVEGNQGRSNGDSGYACQNGQTPVYRVRQTAKRPLADEAAENRARHDPRRGMFIISLGMKVERRECVKSAGRQPGQDAGH
jgi:hypothetical protein